MDIRVISIKIIVMWISSPKKKVKSETRDDAGHVDSEIQCVSWGKGTDERNWEQSERQQESQERGMYWNSEQKKFQGKDKEPRMLKLKPKVPQHRTSLNKLWPSRTMAWRGMGRPLYPAVSDLADTGKKSMVQSSVLYATFSVKRRKCTSACMHMYLLTFLKSNYGRISQKPKVKKLPVRGGENNKKKLELPSAHSLWQYSC